jgi:hypothetical protein
MTDQTMKTANELDLTGLIPESWCCVDCGVNTAPGCSTRVEMEKQMNAPDYSGSVTQHFDDKSEVYTVRKIIWEKAGMELYGGCLCIGCLESRLGRSLKPKDFQRDDPFGLLPGTRRLMKRRGA